MAERRMFAKTIIDSDAFLDMPLSTQALYFHLSMRADDDGFINNPRRIQRVVGASDDDYRLLIAKRFILTFASGVIVIKHWKMHNYIQKDRYKPTVYQEELSQIFIKENGVYTDCIQNVYISDTQERKEIGKVSNSITHAREEEKLKFMGGKLGQGVVLISPEQFDDLCEKLSIEEIDKYISIVAECELKGKSFKKKSHYQAILDMVAKDRGIKNEQC